MRHLNMENKFRLNWTPVCNKPLVAYPESGLVFREEDSGWSTALQSGRQEEEQLLRGRRAESAPLPCPGAHSAPTPNPPSPNTQIR